MTEQFDLLRTPKGEEDGDISYASRYLVEQFDWLRMPTGEEDEDISFVISYVLAFGEDPTIYVTVAHCASRYCEHPSI